MQKQHCSIIDMKFLKTGSKVIEQYLFILNNSIFVYLIIKYVLLL